MQFIGSVGHYFTPVQWEKWQSIILRTPVAALNYAVLMHPNASGHTGYFKPWFGAIILLFYYSFWRRGYPRPPWRPLGPPCAPMTPALFHNLKGTQILYTLTYLDIRGAIKKLNPPSPSPFFDHLNFSDKDFLYFKTPSFQEKAVKVGQKLVWEVFPQIAWVTFLTFTIKIIILGMREKPTYRHCKMLKQLLKLVIWAMSENPIIFFCEAVPQE